MYHFIVSMVKSVIRIVSCIISMFIGAFLYDTALALIVLGAGLAFSEFLGIMEELYNGK